MSFLSMAHMYQVVRDMYPSRKWRERVLHMTDNQIMAIYFDREERAEAHKAKRPEKICKGCRGCARPVEPAESCDEAVASSTDDYIPEQLSFFD